MNFVNIDEDVASVLRSLFESIRANPDSFLENFCLCSCSGLLRNVLETATTSGVVKGFGLLVHVKHPISLPTFHRMLGNRTEEIRLEGLNLSVPDT
mmetsp:Transcript_98590/g.200119  ORF Transcript_98590/g.200119 Transcript_98590/m.200119 type:complete len:96 (+) Transcript_98590:1-288(+)